MNYKFIYVLIATCMFNACFKSNVNENVFLEQRKLLAEKIRINEVFSTDFVTKSGDYFIISSSRSDTTLFLYETPSLEFRNATGKRGNGPDEIQTFPMFGHTLDTKYLYVRGFSHQTIRKISIEPNGCFLFIDEYKLDGYDEYNFMNIVKDSLFIYYNSNNLAITKYDLKNRKEISKVNFKKEAHNESFFYSNRGFIAANDSFVVYPYIYKKQIDIYDLDNFNIVRRIGGVQRKLKIPIDDLENITYHYFNIYAGKKYFYVIYAGRKENDNFYDRTMEVYDYKGNPIIEYTFDIIPFYFVVDEENGYIYATNSNYEDYLLRYKLID